MKRMLSLLMTALIGLTSVPTAVYAQQNSGQITFSQQELDQLLAPIALYPDALLSQVLMATTYPLEVVEAARFAQKNPALKGDALVQAVQAEPWDQSVKALVQFPSVLTMMDDKLAWTQKLGDAFLAQQGAVMDTVQSLRAKAQAAGTLRSNQQQQIAVQDGAIDIEPVAPDVISVPYYNPNVVYGAWWWPDYPPMVWVPPSYYWPPYYGDAIVAGIAFGVGIGITHSLFHDTRPDWRGHHLMNYGPGANRSNGAGVVWNHNLEHRHGVAYRDLATRSRFQPPSPNNVNRDAYRGHVSAIAPAAPRVNSIQRPVEQIRPNNARPALPAARQQPAARSPIAQPHPFMPSGPARVIQSQSARGQASRAGSFGNQGGARGGQQQRPSR